MYKPTDKLRGKKSAANPKTDGAWPYGPLPKPGPTIPSPALPRPTLARRTEPCLDKPPVERPDQPPADRDSVDKDRAREPHPQAPPMLRLTADEVGTLADRLFSRGISTLTTYSRREQADLITASRTLRALLQAYELEAGRPLRVVLLCGGF